MNELKLKAIVLSSIDYKEKDKLVKLFSLELGIITAVLKGVRAQGAKLKFASQPFCFASFNLVKRGNYYTVTSANLEDSFFDLTKDLNSYYTAFTLLEVVQASLMEEETNPLVFVNVLKALKLICYDKLDAKLVLLKFLLGMLKVLCYRVNFKACEVCKMPFVNKKFLNMETGAIVCASCITPTCKQMTNASFNLIKSLYETEMERLNTITATKAVISETLTLIVQNFESRVEKKLKTLKQ